MVLPEGRAAWRGAPLFEVGPYRILRGLVRAPGAWLVEAEDPDHRPILLQLIQLRPINSLQDRTERTDLEQAVLAQTTSLLDEEDQVILAHGGADRIDGTRVLFWALPHPQRIERLASPAGHIESLDHLLSTGIHVGRRVARRHGRGRIEPLLTEHLFLVTDEGAELVGVPVHVPPEWLATDMPNPRRAPEERDGAPTALGDVWRLGRALSTLGDAFVPLPGGVCDLLSGMTAPDPSDRIQSVSEAVAELDALREAVRAVTPPSSIHNTTAVTAAFPVDVVSELVVQSIGASTRVEAATPGVPPWAFFFSLEEYLRFRETAGAAGFTGDETLAEIARLCRGHPPARWEGIVQAFGSEGPTLDGCLVEGLVLGEGGPTVTEGPLQIPEIAPPLVAGRTIADVKPLVLEPDTIDVPQRNLIEDSVSGELPAYEAEEQTPTKRRPGRRHRLILGMLVALAALGGLALAGRTPAGLANAPIVDLDRSVTLEVDTPNAVVIGEDGTILQPPWVFAIPERGDAAVLVAAEHHRPERILLPTGGRIRVALAPRSDEASCRIDAPPHVEVEGIGVELDRRADRLSVNGTAALRVRKGEVQTAHLIRCSDEATTTLQIPKRQRTVLGVNGEARVILDGGSIGHAPLEHDVRSGYHRVEIDGVARWVPVFAPVVVE